MADPHDPQVPAADDGPDAPDAGASPRRSGPRTRRRVDTRDPRRSRDRALKILFQADVRGEHAGDLLARIIDDPRAWAMLDDLDPDEAADLAPAIDAGAAGADAEPHEVAQAAKRRKALELDGFTRSLVQGVADHQAQLDELIQRYARRWTVARMPVIDRCVLRLGTYELAFETTSPAVVINETIELAKRLSTEDSGRYVNGVLESVRKHLADAPLTPPVAGRGAPASSAADAVDVEVEPVVPDAAEPPPFEDVLAAPDDDGDADAPPFEDVLPAPDDDGDAVDLVDPVTPDDADDLDEADPDDEDELAVDDAEVEAVAADRPDDADEDADPVGEVPPEHPQLF